MTPTLAGCEAKLRRVDEHIADLKNIVDSLKADKLFRTVIIPDDEFRVLYPYRLFERRYIVVATDVKPIPHDLGIRVGEIIYGLRSALDNLVYQLIALSGSPAINKNRSEFPIFKNVHEFRRSKKRGRFDGIALADFARLVRLQPYKTGGVNYAKEPLWLIHDLCNVDKHRTIPVAIWALQDADFTLLGQFEYPVRPKVVSESIDLELKEGAKLFYMHILGQPKVNAHMKANVTVCLRFGQGCDAATMLPVLDVVGDARNYVNDRVFPVFRPLFP